MESLVEKEAWSEERGDGSDENCGKPSPVADWIQGECRESTSSLEMSMSEETEHDERSRSSSEESLTTLSQMGWSIEKPESPKFPTINDEKTRSDNEENEKQTSNQSEIEMMKERFSKLLLGEDLSGCGKGVSTALAISNAITNLCATLFGQLWRLEPLAPEKKSMWHREMEWLLCASDHIVELSPSWQTFPDGSKLEVMTCRPRSDLYINLPALRKLDNMLLEILDGFSDTDFWYVDQGVTGQDSDGSGSFCRPLQRQEEKWWLPVPRVPDGGLHENSRKDLQHKRECTNQILKAAMAINSNALAEMEVPQSYLETLPKNGRACLGDIIHRFVTSDEFYPECLLDCLDLSSEHHSLEIADRVEGSMYIWRRKTNTKTANNTTRFGSKSSWEIVKELVVDADKKELFADRAESLLLCLKQRFPGLSQTTLDMSKIQYNRDVGKSILESYSRVLESMAFNIIARIDDLLYVDDLTKHSDHFTSVPTVSVIAQKRVSLPCPMSISGTPYVTAFTTPSLSPGSLVSPAKRERSALINSKPVNHGFSVKRALTDYLGVETKSKSRSCDNIDVSNAILTTVQEPTVSRTNSETHDWQEGSY